jgi:hypothetical protein
VIVENEWGRIEDITLTYVTARIWDQRRLGPLCREFARILEESPYWDPKVKVLQVTDAKEHTLDLRALASAADASTAWDLRCEVREKLIEFLQKNYPESLPRVRAELHPTASGGV